MWQTVTSQNIGNILWLSKHQVETTISRCYFLYALGYENPTTWRLQHFGRCIHLIQQLFFARVLLDSWNLAPQILSKFTPKTSINFHRIMAIHGSSPCNPAKFGCSHVGPHVSMNSHAPYVLPLALVQKALEWLGSWKVDGCFLLFEKVGFILSTNGYWSTQRCFFLWKVRISWIYPYPPPSNSANEGF